MDARAQHGHTTFVRTSAQSTEAFRVCSPRKYLENFTASQFGSEAILYCRVHHLYGKLAYGEHATLVILWIIHTYCTIQFQGLIRDRER